MPSLNLQLFYDVNGYDVHGALINELFNELNEVDTCLRAYSI